MLCSTFNSLLAIFNVGPLEEAIAIVPLFLLSYDLNSHLLDPYAIKEA
jgi:hypothetical protein